MRVSTAWLSEWVETGWDTARLAHRLTMAGFEVEAIEAAAPPFDGVLVARIVRSEPHPDADKLSVCTVDHGGAETVQVVCGASNARAGLTVALATAGASLPGGLVIRQARLRGVESSGMLCSARELGLGEGHEGILELPDELVPGTALRQALGLDDTLLELNLTPNRGDALSMAGVARELSAISGAPLKKLLASREVSVTATAGGASKRTTSDSSTRRAMTSSILRALNNWLGMGGSGPLVNTLRVQPGIECNGGFFMADSSRNMSLKPRSLERSKSSC